jgi:ribosomal protein S27AE
METVKLYSMYYDDKTKGNNGFGDYLGEFRHVKQLREDFYVDDFLAVDTKTNDLCLILSREIKGVGGGLAYSVHPVKTLGDYKIHSEQDFAEWKMVVDDFDDGKGNRELPHCSKCGRGVYKHDAGLYCPFCGALMKNPMRY